VFRLVKQIEVKELTNSMEQSPSWEADSRTDSQKSPLFMEPENSLPSSQGHAVNETHGYFSHNRIVVGCIGLHHNLSKHSKHVGKI